MTIAVETCVGGSPAHPHPSVTHDEITCPLCAMLGEIYCDIEEVEYDLRYSGLESAKESQANFRAVSEELAKLLPGVVTDLDSEIYQLLTTLERSIDMVTESVAQEVTALENLQ